MTSNQFQTLEDLYQYYNHKLFGGKLAECLVNLSRHGGAHGFFVPREWVSTPPMPQLLPDAVPSPKGEKVFVPKLKVIHEISLTPDSINRPDKEWHSTLVHEMVHLWQYDFGKISRPGYHNSQWAKKMEAVGLMPTDTGLPEGKKTGQGMTHYVIKGGAFEKVFESIAQADLERLTLPFRLNRKRYGQNENTDLIQWLLSQAPELPERKTYRYANPDPDQPKSRSGVKAKYVCACDNRVWGKPDLKIMCVVCGCGFLEC